jgi:hypothetical protein
LPMLKKREFSGKLNVIKRKLLKKNVSKLRERLILDKQKFTLLLF